jgi:hypothetical protein
MTPGASGKENESIKAGFSQGALGAVVTAVLSFPATRSYAADPTVIRIGVAQPAAGSPPAFANSSVAIAHAKGRIARVSTTGCSTGSRSQEM